MATDAEIKNLLNLQNLPLEEIETRVEAVKDVFASLEGVIADVDAKTKLLFATMSNTDWINDWSKTLELQIESEKTLGNIVTGVEKEQYIRGQITDQLEKELGTLLRSQRLKQQAVESQREEVRGLQERIDAGDTEASTRRSLNSATLKLTELEAELTAVSQGRSREYIKQLSLQVRQNKALDNLADASEGMIGNVTGIGTQWKKGVLGSIIESASAAEGFTGKISAIGKGLSEGFAKALTPMNIFMSTMQKIVEMTVMMIIKFDQVSIGFRQAQGVGEDWDKSITRVYHTNEKFSMTLDESTAALGDVKNSMISLRVRGKEAVESMANFIGPLKRLGIDGVNAGKAMEHLMKGMKKSQPEAEAMTRRMITLAGALGKPPQNMIAEFNAAMPQLAAYGKDAQKVFEGMQVQAAATGVEMSKLVSIAEKFDTFSDAARNVGTLNAVLGGAYFNSLEMMNANHEERIKLLHEGFSATGKSFDQLGYYERKALATAAGFSDMGEAQKFFNSTTEDYAEVQRKAQEEDAAAAEQKKKLEEMMASNVTMANNFTRAMEALGGAFEPLMPIIRGVVSVIGTLIFGLGEIINYFTTTKAGLIILYGAFAAFSTVLIPLAVTLLSTAFGFFMVNGAVSKWRVALMLLLPALSLLVGLMRDPGSLPFYLVLPVIAAGFYAISTASTTMLTPLSLAAPAVLMFGAGLALAGLGAALLAVGIVIVIDAFIRFIKAVLPAVPQIVVMSLAIGGLALAMGTAALAAIPFALALPVLALGFGGLAIALALIKTKDLEALGEIFMGIGMSTSKGAVEMAKLPSAIKAIVKELDDLEFDKLDEMADSINNLASAAERLAALGPVGLKIAAMFGRPTAVPARPAAPARPVAPVRPVAAAPVAAAAAPAARVRTVAAQTESVKIATQAALSAKASTEITREVVQIIKEKFTSEQVAAGAGAAATLPEGVLITRDIVVDLGTEFDYKLKRKVRDIVEAKLKRQ